MVYNSRFGQTAIYFVLRKEVLTTQTIALIDVIWRTTKSGTFLSVPANARQTVCRQIMLGDLETMFITDACDRYAARLGQVLSDYQWSGVENMTRIIFEAWQADNHVFLCGNGGSAANAIHLANDFLYGVAGDLGRGISVEALPANSSVLTCLANDISYDEVFVHQLQLLASAEDVLLTVSSSGDSENVVRAAAWAKDTGMKVVALTGFDGGRTADLATINLHVAGDNYGIIEDVHQSLMHLMGQYIRHARMADDLIQSCRF